MARRGARVIMACRDIAKAEEAAAFVRKESGNGNVFVEELDLSSLESVCRCAERVNANEERIDVLLNNAGKALWSRGLSFNQLRFQINFVFKCKGIMACPKWQTKDGHEMQFGTNHLGHYLLTMLLLEKIKKNAPSRIINVSSLAHKSIDALRIRVT